MTPPSDSGERCDQWSAGSRCIYGAGHATEYHCDEHNTRWPVYCAARRLELSCILRRGHLGGHYDYVGNVWDVPALPPDAPPCCDCGTTTADRSACPLCAKVYCQPCAEKPYETCCDNGVPL